MNATSPVSIEKRAVEWSVALSVVIIVIGMEAVLMPAAAGSAVTFLLGWLLIFSGIAHLVFGWDMRTAGGFGWEVALGILYFFAGGYVLFHVRAALAALTVVLGSYLFVEAILEFVLAYRLRPLPRSGWLTIDGAVTMVLAILIWKTWPAAWAIGFLVGISMLVSGFSRLALSLAAARAVSKLPER
jgi:uncharacterized membrane protein HdeD (DUF308 family)